MSKYRRNGRWTVRVPNPVTHGLVEKSIGTKDRAIATQYQSMLRVLLSRPQDHLFLRAVCENQCAITRLFGHYWAGTLETLRLELSDVDLTPRLAEWVIVLENEFGAPGKSEDTARKYPDQVRQFFRYASGVAAPAPLVALRSHYTIEHVSRFLGSLPVATATKRRFWAALRRFGVYLRSVGVLPRDQEPLAGLNAPKAGKARERHLSEAERDALIAAAPIGPIRTAEVLAHMGMELSAILATSAKDVNLTERTVKMRGTKNRFRDRVGVIEDWAEPHLRAALKSVLPAARLVAMPGDDLRDAHYDACKAVGIAGYRLHDARHTFAVIWWDEGVPASVIGLQLGHADGRTVEGTYGKHRVSLAQLKHWAGVVAAKRQPTKSATSEGSHGL